MTMLVNTLLISHFEDPNSYLRLFLSEVSGLSPMQLEFDKTIAGKPYLKNAGLTIPIHFSISYTDNLVAIATAEKEIGIDIEMWKEDFDPLELAHRYFSPDEHRILQDISSEKDRRSLFLNSWTRKEALIKAQGNRIADGLGIFGTLLLTEKTTLTYKNQWTVQNFECGIEGVYGALAINSTDPIHVQTNTVLKKDKEG